MKNLVHRRAALLARIQRRWAVTTQIVQVGELTIHFTRVVDPDRVLQQMAAEQDAAADNDLRCHPYWAEAWDSARGLAEVLVRQSLEGLRVLDLGCGLGLTGAVAAAKGAHVLMADAASPALLLARLNSWPWQERVHLRQLDWRTDHLDGERFHWIVGSDILYDRQDWPWLERFWRVHLDRGGLLMLAEPGRSSGQEFCDWLARRRWSLCRWHIPLPGKPRPIRIIQATEHSASATRPTASRSQPAQGRL